MELRFAQVNTPCAERTNGSRNVSSSENFDLRILLDSQRVVIHTVVRTANRREEIFAGFGGAEIERQLHADLSFILLCGSRALRDDLAPSLISRYQHFVRPGLAKARQRHRQMNDSRWQGDLLYLVCTVIAASERPCIEEVHLRVDWYARCCHMDNHVALLTLTLVLPNSYPTGDDQRRGHCPADDSAAPLACLLPIPPKPSIFGEALGARSQMKTRWMGSRQTIFGQPRRVRSSGHPIRPGFGFASRKKSFIKSKR